MGRGVPQVLKSGRGLGGLPHVPYVLLEDGSVLVVAEGTTIEKFKSMTEAMKFLDTKKYLSGKAVSKMA